MKTHCPKQGHSLKTSLKDAVQVKYSANCSLYMKANPKNCL